MVLLITQQKRERDPSGLNLLGIVSEVSLIVGIGLVVIGTFKGPIYHIPPPSPCDFYCVMISIRATTPGYLLSGLALLIISAIGFGRILITRRGTPN